MNNQLLYAAAFPLTMTYQMQPLFRPTFDAFSSWGKCHYKSQITFEESYNDAFGFDPIPTERVVLDQYHNTAGVLSVRAYQPPTEFSLAFLEQQSYCDAQVPVVQNSGSHTLDTFSVSDGSSVLMHHGIVTMSRTKLARNRFLEAFDRTAGTTDDPATKKSRRKAQPMSLSTSSNRKIAPSKARLKCGRKARDSASHLSVASQHDKRKALSLEKNRIAAAKCRINRKEKVEQMQQDSHEKVKKNMQLRRLIESMEDEIHTLIVYLSGHAQSSECKKADQLKLALQMVQEADMSKRFPGLGSGTTSKHNPKLSMSDRSAGSGSRRDSDMTADRSSATETPPMAYNLFADLVVDSPTSG